MEVAKFLATSVSYLLMISVVMFSLGAYGLEIFLNCDFFKKDGDQWGTQAGFTVTEWQWFYAACILLPLGLIPFVMWLVLHKKEPESNYPVNLFLQLFVWSASVWITNDGYEKAKVLECLVVPEEISR